MLSQSQKMDPNKHLTNGSKSLCIIPREVATGGLTISTSEETSVLSSLHGQETPLTHNKYTNEMSM